MNTFIALVAALLATTTVSIGQVTAPLIFSPATATPTTTPRQEIYLSALEWCESSGIPSNINPKDLDGTPSLGAFQFKPSTFDLYSKKYGIATTSVMSEPEQRAIVRGMIHDPSIRWHHQFPDCVAKLGLPPRD